MIEFITNVLFNITFLCGCVIIISLLLIITFRIICILIDHLRIGNMVRKALIMYLKQKRPDLKIQEKDIVVKKGEIGIERKELK